MNAMDIRLQQAIAAARAGRRDEARVLLDQFLEDQPDNVHALFLKSTLVSDKREQVDYLRKVMSIDPEHRGAKLMLDRLGEPSEPEPEKDEAPSAEAEELEVQEEGEALVVSEEDLPADEDLAETMVIAPVETGDPDGVEIGEVEAGETEMELEETLVVFPDQEVLDDIDIDSMEDQEEEEIPAWLAENEGDQGDIELTQIQEPKEEEMPIEMGELPDWLQEEPTEEWLSQEPHDAPETDFDFDEPPAEEVVALAEEEPPTDAPEPTAAPRRPKPRVSRRVLEIALGLLILLAVLVMAGLVYVFLTF